MLYPVLRGTTYYPTDARKGPLEYIRVPGVPIEALERDFQIFMFMGQREYP